MANAKLIKIKKLLKNYFCYFKHPNVLVISEDKSVLPFAYIIVDKSHPASLLLSLAINYPTTINVAEVILVAQTIFPISLADPFYIAASDGKTYLNEDAYDMWGKESVDLSSIMPLSEERH